MSTIHCQDSGCHFSIGECYCICDHCTTAKTISPYRLNENKQSPNTDLIKRELINKAYTLGPHIKPLYLAVIDLIDRVEQLEQDKLDLQTQIDFCAKV